MFSYIYYMKILDEDEDSYMSHIRWRWRFVHWDLQVYIWDTWGGEFGFVGLTQKFFHQTGSHKAWASCRIYGCDCGSSHWKGWLLPFNSWPGCNKFCNSSCLCSASRLSNGTKFLVTTSSFQLRKIDLMLVMELVNCWLSWSYSIAH